MALRIYPIRPLRYGRGYYGGQQGSPAAAFTGGEAMGKMAGGAVMDFQKWQAQQKLKQQQDAQNALADKLENTVTPPRAGLVSAGVNPLTGQGNVVGAGVPTAGTAPFSAGAAGMKLQQDFIRSSLENQRLAQEVRNSGIASNMAARRGGGGGGDGGGGQGNANRWQQYLGGQGGQGGQGASKAGKPAAYQPGSSTPDQPNYYNFNNQRTDIDAQYGKGTYDRMLANAGNITVDPKTGKYGVKTTVDPDTGQPAPVSKDISVDPDTGDVTLKGSGQHAGAHIPFNELQSNMARYDGTLVQQGKQPRFADQYLKTQNPQSGLPNGDAANPYMPSNTAELQGIAPGKSFVNPTDGKVYQKQPPQQPAAQQPPTKGTTQVDTGDQSQQVAGAQLPPQQALPPSLLQPLPGGQPQTPQQGLAGGDSGQGQGQDYTGGQSQLSPVMQGPQPPVDVASLNPSSTPGSFFPGAAPSTGGLAPDVDLSGEIARTQLASRLQGVA